jgi:hypothetical protein
VRVDETRQQPTAGTIDYGVARARGLADGSNAHTGDTQRCGGGVEETDIGEGHGATGEHGTQTDAL